ncbi:MAG TPA: histidine kinase [Mucilaginibacter sp.]|jgi:hypothetical protein|nr:histidine kinase [Mucilaginibacter sp.]
MFRFRAYQTVFHIAGWLLFMAFPLLFINGGQDDLALMLNKPFYWLFCGTYVFLFYLNSYVLVPQLLLKKKHTLYSIIILALLAGTYYLKPYDRLVRNEMRLNPEFRDWSPMRDRLLGKTMPGPPHEQPAYPPDEDGRGGPPPPGDSSYKFGPPPGLRKDTMHRMGPSGSADFRNGNPQNFGRHRPFDVISFFIFLMIIALSTAMKIMEQWRMTETRAIQAESDKASAELSFLKAQINPHFLFNTLNNIYTLTLIKDDNAPDSILKLSNIMRYVTDDVMEDFVPLQQEVDCINDYIELQRLRIGEKTQLDIEISGDIDDKKVPPLILMTFVENVFKYGVSKRHKSNITIKLKGDNSGITFFCQNNIFPEKNEKRRVGIGLKNTEQRLEHLYPNKHILDIKTDNQLYTVKLILQIA